MQFSINVVAQAVQKTFPLLNPKQQPDFQVTIVVKVDRKSLENAKYKIQSNINNFNFLANCCG